MIELTKRLSESVEEGNVPKRLLLKLSGEALGDSDGKGFNDEAMLAVGGQVKAMLKRGYEISIVIGGGNFWRGRNGQEMDRSKADQIGMLATVMNALFAREMFIHAGIESVVVTPFPVGAFTEVYAKDRCNRHFKEGKVIFFAGGTGHPFFTTDTAAALRAIEMDVDLILFAKNVDGVYDKDPHVFKDAKRYSKLSYQELIEKKLKAIDITAATMCQEKQLPMILFHFDQKDSILRAAEDDYSGTYLF